MDIKRWETGAVIYSCEAPSMLELVERAVRESIDLSRANLSGADLSGANLSRANLSRANLYGANLSGANLSRANLSGANLSRANLSRANLYGADLYGANLSRANLSRADLSDANLSRADLYGAKVIQIGPLGSRNDFLVYKWRAKTDAADALDEIMTGCFCGTLVQFKAAVERQHGTNEFGEQYRRAIAYIEGEIVVWQKATTA